MDHGRVSHYVSDLAAHWPVTECRWIRRDATIVVADVCGFTHLSERLGKLGPEGTEAVKEIVNAVFEPCLDHALRAGADVLDFAGDGFVALFDGSAHPERAARAAAAMQRSMREIGSRRTPAGTIRPRLSVGLESGSLAAYVLGESTHERIDLVTAGGLVDAAFELESMAEPGQVRIGERLAAALPQAWHRAVRGGPGRRLHLSAVPSAQCGALVDDGGSERAVGPLREPSSGQPRQFLDPAVVETIEGVGRPTEHRTITVAFVVADGVADDAADAGSREFVDRMSALTDTVASACRRHGVCWLESDSVHGQVRLMLTVGAPIRREHDTARLLRAVHEISGEHQVAIGIARGRAFVGDVGHPLRRTYNVMGPVVNLAARIAGSAATGSILVTSEVAGLVADTFEVTAEPSLQLKGITEPVEVASITGPRTTAMSRPARSDIHGRGRELADLRGRLEALDRGEGAAIEIVGDAGVGKTRIVDAMTESAEIDTFWATGHRDRQTAPYAAISTLVRQMLRIGSDDPPEAAGDILLDRISTHAPELLTLAPLIATAAQAEVAVTDEASAVAPHLRAARTREVLVALLTELRPGPTLVVAEDIHWFDAASRLMLAGLATIGRPWLIVATRRPDEESLDGFTTLELEPLADDATRDAILDALHDTPISRRALEEIVAASGGNPLFASELASVAALDGPTLPDGVEEIVESRLDRLDLDSRLMLRDLAVVGPHAEPSLVDALLAEHGLGDEALLLMDDFITTNDGGVSFRHELYRRTAYEGLSIKRRRELHERRASHLAGLPDRQGRAAEISEHAHHAGNARLTWEWSRTAGQEALAEGASHEAAIHLARALDAARDVDADPGEEARVAELLGDACELAARLDDAHAAYRRARAVISGAPVEQARLYRKHARVHQRAGRFRAALQWSTRGLRLLQGDPDVESGGEVTAELLLVAGVVRFFQGRFELAIDLATRAAVAAERVGATAQLAQAHLQLEMTHSELGHKRERAIHGARALELLESLDDRLGLANLHLNLGVSQYNEAKWHAAVSHYERSAHYFRLVGDTIGAEAARNNQAEILTDQGHLGEAAQILEGVERSLRAANYPLGVAITISGRARVALRQGAAERAGELLASARKAFVELDARHMVLDTDVRRVEHLVWIGDTATAGRLADDVDAVLSDIGPVAILPATLARLRGWNAFGDDDRGAAETHFRRAQQLAQAESFDYEVALALDGLIAIGCSADDVDRQRVDELFEDLGIVRAPRPTWLLADDATPAGPSVDRVTAALGVDGS